MKLIHLTDPHLTPESELLFGVDPRTRLARCIDEIARAHADAELCVITGDLSHRGTTDGYEFLREQVARLPMPVHLLVGNHDDRDRLCDYFPAVARDDQGFVQGEQRTSAGVCLFLDTLLPGSSAGAYCEARREWLRDRLDEAGATSVYLFMHHPPFGTGIPLLDRLGLTDRDEFQALMAGVSNVRYVFFGHAHLPIHGVWRGIGYTTLYATAHQFVPNFETDDLARLDRGPEYSVVLIDEDQVVMYTRGFER